MSLAIKYESVEDAKLRLRGTVVLYRDAPVYIRDVMRGKTADDIFRVLFDELPIKPGARIGRGDDPEDADGKKFISSKHFDIAPFKMGYVNRQGDAGAFYSARMPNRVQKQGLCAENFRAHNNEGKGVDFNTFLASKDVLDMIMGKYPTFDQAIKALNKASAVAFSREFAVSRDPVINDLIFLYYKGSKVGMYNEKQVTLGDKFQCLKESLGEMKIRVGAR